MHETLLKQYHDELSYLKESGKGFAEAHPNLAAQLKLGGDDLQDPFIERLIQSFAFLSARANVQSQQTEEKISQALLQQLYPYLSSPFPSCSVVQFNTDEDMNNNSFVAAGSEFAARTLQDKACTFRTAYDLQLMPLQISRLEYRLGGKTPASMKLTLQTISSDTSLVDCLRDDLVLHINASQSITNKLYTLLFAHCSSINAISNGQAITLYTESLSPMGFADNETLLPTQANTSHAQRCLHEYLNWPKKYSFIKLKRLADYISDEEANTLELEFYFSEHFSGLETEINQTSLQLNCTPVVNLFKQSAEPIHLTQDNTEFTVVADASRPFNEIEVYSINTADLASDDNEIACYPLLKQNYSLDQRQKAIYWSYEKVACQSMGAYTTPGTEVLLSHTEQNCDVNSTAHAILTPQLICSNRNLCQQILLDGNGKYLQATEGEIEGVDSIQFIDSISEARYPEADKHHYNNLLQIALLHQGELNQADALNNLQHSMQLLSPKIRHDAAQTIKALTSLKIEKGMQRHPDFSHFSYCHGLNLSLQVEESLLNQHSSYLLGSVLSQYFAYSSGINSYSKLTLTEQKSKREYQWPAQFNV